MADGFEYKKNDFEHKAYLYDRKMELVSEDEKTQSLFNEILSVDDKEKYKDDIATAHGYAIVGIDDNNIYLKNPWHTYKDIAVPLDVFEDYWGSVEYTEIK